MNELKVIESTQIIKTNFEEFHKELKKNVAEYKGLVVTADNLSDMKKTRQELTKGKKIINDKRKEIKKAYNEPLKKFEEQCKIAIATIEEAEDELKENIDEYDERVREEHLDYALKTAQELAEAEGLEDDYFNRIDTVSNYANLTMTKKKIFTDIDKQVTKLSKLQKNKYRNKAYVEDQLKTASKLAGLSTPLVMEDIQHLIDDYETLDTVAVTEGITSVALRRKEAEELAIKREEERIKREAEEKARREAEIELAKEREKIRIEEEAKQKAEFEKREAERLAEKAKRKEEEEQLKASEEAFVIPGDDDEWVTGEVEEPVEVETEPVEHEWVTEDTVIENDKYMVIRIRCKESETADIVRLLAIEGYDCEVER